MRRVAILASVLAAAIGSAKCSQSPSASILAPSSVEAGAAAATAAKGGGGGKPGGGGTTGGGGGTINWVMVDDKNGDQVPSFTDTITFAVQTSSTTKPWVTVKCSQNGTLVYKESNGIFSTSLDQNFTLGPSTSWPSGAADCTATLENWDSYSKNGSITVLTSTTFRAN